MKVKTACNCKSNFEENPVQPKIVNLTILLANEAQSSSVVKKSQVRLRKNLHTSCFSLTHDTNVGVLWL